MPDFPVSSIVDNLLLMSLVEINSSLHRCISVVKARGCKHSFDTREFAIGQGGIMLLPEDASPVNTQVPLPAFEPAGAEFAAVGAADLGGDAERVTVARFAVERRVRRDEHAFDQRLVAQPPQELLRGVARPLFADELKRAQLVMRLQLRAQGLGQIRHRLPGSDAMRVEPLEHLRDSIGRLAPGPELDLQLFGGLRLYIRQHLKRLTHSDSFNPSNLLAIQPPSLRQ